MADLFEQTTPDDFSFPFSPYAIQSDLMKTIFETIEKSRVGIFESPTGTGKSLSVICSTITWLKADRLRVTDTSIRQLLDKLKQENPDEPEWVLEQEVQRKRRELVEDEEILEERLREIRLKETEARKNKHPMESTRQVKKQKLLGVADYSDEEFAPEADPHTYRDEIGENGLPRSVQDILDSFSAVKPKYHEVELEPDCRKIFFTSRTHSQLSQFTGEIRKTVFKEGLRVIALGSRSNLCINRDVRSKAKSLDAINEACMELQKADKGKRCPHLPSLDEQERLVDFRDHALAEIHDIEELAALGRELNCCPYYGVRRAVKRAHVVTLPYNLILQASSREALGISLDGNVLVIDEAHNLIDNILAIHSVCLSSKFLERIRTAFEFYVKRFSNRLKGTNLVHLKHFIRVLDSLIEFCKTWVANVSSSQLQHEEITTIDAILEKSKALDQINVLELEKYLQESKIVNKVAGYSAKSEQLKSSASFDKGYQTRSAFISAFYSIRTFLSALSNNHKEGRVLVTMERKNQTEPPLVNLKYQLLDPSSSFREIVEKTRSVILAGGTMAPISGFQTQLFPFLKPQDIVDFSCSHIVPAENVLVRVVSKGPMGSKLELKFTSKGDTKLLDDLGQSLSNISNLMPHGLVCFCPSYSILDILIQRWKHTGLWDRLAKKKQIFIEPKTSGDVEKTLQGYSDAIRSPSQSKNGSLMLAVIGGKLSEGINFSNDLCRVVVVMGIPYPNAQSVELKERMHYIENLHGGTKEAGITFYTNLAFKAVNQSIGRSIRHANDWSAIILLDARYGHPSNVNRLPTWIRSSMVTTDGFGPLVRDLAQFKQRMLPH